MVALIDLEQYAISLYAMKIWMGYFNSDFILNIIFVSCVPLKKMEVLQWSVVSVIQRLTLRAFIKTFISSEFISPFTIFSIYKHFWSTQYFVDGDKDFLSPGSGNQINNPYYRYSIDYPEDFSDNQLQPNT